mgnify:CR=1 FL=1
MKKILILLALSLLFWGCNEKNVTENNTNGQIAVVEPQATFVGDTVNLFGENFGVKNYLNFILSVEGEKLSSEDALIWNNTKISFEVPPEFETSKYYLIVQKDTADSFDLEINRIISFPSKTVQTAEFSMGSKSGANDEKPVHEVTLTNTLEVGMHEVSCRLFENVMGYLPELNSDKTLPVRNVSWIEAVEFCNELSKLQGLDTNYTILENNAKWDSTTNGWRLPTEAEWEYLAKAEGSSDFPFGNELTDYGWYNLNSGMKVHPSGRKYENENGLYDMNGNVWEWCWDYYATDYYANSPYEDPKGPASGERRVRRGGSAVDGGFYARSTNRKVPDGKIEFTGFRIVRTVIDE